MIYGIAKVLTSTPSGEIENWHSGDGEGRYAHRLTYSADLLSITVDSCDQLGVTPNPSSAYWFRKIIGDLLGS
jgi:hypothetical protein